VNKPSPTAVYMASVPFVSIVVNVTFLGAIFLATDVLGAPEWQLGLLGAAVTGTYALLCPILGRLVGGTSPRSRATAVCVMYVLFALAVPMTRGFWPLLTLVVILGVAGALYWPMVESVAAAGRSGAGMRRSLGTYNVLWSVGVTCGTFLAGPLFEFGTAWPFYGASVVAVVLLGVFLATPSPADVVEAVDSPVEEDPDALKVSPEVANSFLYLSKALVFLAYFSYGCLRSLFRKYGAQLEFSVTGTATLLFVTVLAQTGTFVLLRNTGFWHYRHWPLLLAAGLGAGSFALIASVSSPLLMVPALAALGFFTGCAYFSSIYYSMARPKANVESAAWHEMTLGIGLTLGPITGGLFAQRAGGVAAAFLLMAVVALAGFGITLQFLLRGPSAAEARR